jgi:hypothetical protein
LFYGNFLWNEFIVEGTVVRHILKLVCGPDLYLISAYLEQQIASINALMRFKSPPFDRFRLDLKVREYEIAIKVHCLFE